EKAPARVAAKVHARQAPQVRRAQHRTPRQGRFRLLVPFFLDEGALRVVDSRMLRRRVAEMNHKKQDPQGPQDPERDERPAPAGSVQTSPPKTTAWAGSPCYS